MAFDLRYCVVFLLLSMVTQGVSSCSFDNIEIGTVRTGKEIGGKPEWKVTVTNTCGCIQELVTLSCGGFDPVKPVDPELLLSQGDDKCLLIKGKALPAGGNAQFTYAAEPYIFRPVGSTLDPSCNRFVS